MNVYEKLLEVQYKLKAPKNQRNEFGKYNYRNCEDILESAKPHLKEVRAVLFLSDDVVMVGDRYYVKATALFVDCDDPTAVVSNSAYAREEDIKKGMDGSQITGASSSYARKYALNGLFDIDDTKDSDATNDGTDPAVDTRPTRPAPGKPVPSAPAQTAGARCKRCKDQGKTTFVPYDIAKARKTQTGFVLCDACYGAWQRVQEQDAMTDASQEGVAE